MLNLINKIVLNMLIGNAKHTWLYAIQFGLEISDNDLLKFHKQT